MAEQIGERSAQPAGSAQAPGWGLWLWWVLASAVGGGGGVFGGEFVGWLGVGLVGRLGGGGGGGGVVVDVVGVVLMLGVVVGLVVVGGGVVGLVLGVLQWLVLRRQVARAGWWVLASTVGGVLGVGFGFGLGFVLMLGVGVGIVVVLGGVLGLVLGVLQWLVLRRQVARAGWWVLASTVGGVGLVGRLVGGFVASAVGVFEGVFGVGIVVVLGGIVGGAVYGAITGLALVWLLRQRAAGADDAITE